MVGRTRFVKTQLTLLRYYLRRAAHALADNQFDTAKELLAAAKRAHQRATSEVPKLSQSDDSKRLAAAVQIHAGDLDELEQQINKNCPLT